MWVHPRITKCSLGNSNSDNWKLSKSSNNNWQTSTGLAEIPTTGNKLVTEALKDERAVEWDSLIDLPFLPLTQTAFCRAPRRWAKKVDGSQIHWAQFSRTVLWFLERFRGYLSIFYPRKVAFLVPIHIFVQHCKKPCNEACDFEIWLAQHGK